LLGRVIEDRYRVCRRIGQGAMGVVYEALHLLINRKVALKTLAAHATLSPASVQRFRREAQAAAAVGNSHIVDVLDMGRIDEGTFYIVLEHLDGCDLGFALAVDGRFSVGRAVHILCQLCDALSAVHAAGIVHRDLKPENIFLIVRDGTRDFVKVLDFGVCKFDDRDGGRLTQPGDTVGTPQFMAPEQIEGRRDLDHRVDIYALGALLYYLLTGRAPFDAPNLPRLFLKICSEPSPSILQVDPTLPSELDALVRRAMQKEPERRYKTCAELKAALLPFVHAVPSLSATLPQTTAAEFIGKGTTTGRETAALIRALRLRRPKALQYLGLAAFTLAGAGAMPFFLTARSNEPASRSTNATETARAALPALPHIHVDPATPATRPDSEAPLTTQKSNARPRAVPVGNVRRPSVASPGISSATPPAHSAPVLESPSSHASAERSLAPAGGVSATSSEVEVPAASPSPSPSREVETPGSLQPERDRVYLGRDLKKGP